MKIIELVVKNFRQFYGEQTICFSEHKTKNITLIHGENNGGKTALLNAMLWCLYGKTSHNFQNPKNLLNKHAASINDNGFHVRMTIEVPSMDHDELPDIIEIIRTKENLRVLKRIGHSVIAVENTQYFINTILPVDMANHFFYQGEGSGTLNEATSFQNITKSIEEILGLSVADKAIDDLKKIRRAYENQRAELDRSGESERFVKDKQNKENQLASLQLNYTEATNKVEASKDAMDVIERKLMESDSSLVKEKEMRRKNVTALLDQTTKILEQVQFKKSDLVKKHGAHAFSYKLGQVDIKNIDTKELNLKHPFTISKNLVSEIIKHSKCICGSSVTNDSEAFTKIETLLKEAVDPELRERWNKVDRLSLNLKQSGSKLQSSITTILKDKVSAEYQAKQHHAELEEISSQLQTKSGLDDIAILERERRLHRNKYETSVSEKTRFERDISSVERDIVGLERKIRDIGVYTPEMEKYQNYVTSTDRIIELISTELASAKDDIYSRILMRMNEFLKKISWQGYQARTDGSHIRLIDREGKPADTGNGFQTMLAVSFIIALIFLAKERSSASGSVLTPGTIAPFIADAPFGYLSYQNSKSMAEHIAESVEQVVFMLSTTHWTSYVDEGINEKIGSEYNLVQHTTLSKKQFKEEHSTSFEINGQIFDVVRFDAAFDHVTIEEITRND